MLSSLFHCILPRSGFLGRLPQALWDVERRQPLAVEDTSPQALPMICREKTKGLFAVVLALPVSLSPTSDPRKAQCLFAHAAAERV